MSSSYRQQSVRVGSGRVLEALVDPRRQGRPLVFHWGTPSAGVWFEPLARAAREADLRLVTYSRPGYAGSTPHPGRHVADGAADITAILDALGEDTFLSLGWSGGGPHSLACAAMLPERCMGAATIAGVAPYPAPGLDWMAGMGSENVEEFSAAMKGEGALRPLLEKLAADLRAIEGTDVAAALGGLVSDVDKAALTGEFAQTMATSFRGAVENGIEGWLEDDLAFATDWGFSLGDIKVPVSIWQGAEDRMVPFAHGQWLSENIPGVRTHLFNEHGHLSLGVGLIDEIVRELAENVSPAEAIRLARGSR